MNPTGQPIVWDEWLAKTIAEVSAKHNKEAACGKEMGESGNAGKLNTHTPAAPGDDNNKDLKVLINNDPHYQKGESVSGKSKSNKSKTGPAKKTKSKDSPKNKSKKKASNQYVFKKISSLNEDERFTLLMKLAANKNYIFFGGKPTLAYIETMTNLKFSNLNPKQKAKFVEYFKILYPEQYVEEMAKDQ